MISSRQRKYALVTGASSGIGREYAAQLAAKGYDLVMAGNRNEENRAAAREIAARYGVRTLPLCMDLSEPDAAVKLHAETSARGIEIGVLVCNAGVLLFGPLAAAPPERIGRSLAGLFHHGCNCSIATPPAGERNGTVRAEIIATILYFQKITGTVAT